MYWKALKILILLLISPFIGALAAPHQDSQQLARQLAREIKANLTGKYSHLITPGIEKNWINPLISKFEDIAPGIIDLHAKEFERDQKLEDESNEDETPLHAHLHSKFELQHRLKKRATHPQKAKQAKKHALKIVKHIKKDLIKAAKAISTKKSK
jgi:hypothetical protein